MPRTALVPRQLRWAPFRGSDAVAAGLLTRRQLEGACWRRLYPDVYVHTGVELDHRNLCYAAALMLRERGAVSGRSAAYLWGADVLTRAAKVEVTIPNEVRVPKHPGLIVVRSWLSDDDVTSQALTPVTTRLRTAFDLARRLPTTEAVVAVDALLYRNVITLTALGRFADDRAGWPGLPRLRVVLGLADPDAESPMESRLRLVIIDAGLPRPVSQYRVFDDNGLFVARLDLAYPARKIGIEYEGDHHRGRGVFQYDLQRLNTLRTLGWTVLRFSADDVLRHPERIAAQIKAVLAI
jgi:Protein of unknown function (DUF559)